jgi:DnaJ-class molecular chaperone
MSDTFTPTDAVLCPECGGSGQHVVYLRQRPYENGDEPPDRVDTCSMCLGLGKVTAFQLAIYRARGGSAPVPLRGFA